MVSRIPLGRMGTRKDMANTVLYTVSDAASYVTGTVIVADGGSWMTFDSFPGLSASKSKL